MAIIDEMIPYVIEHAVSNGAYTDEANIVTTYGTTLLSTLESTFINPSVFDNFSDSNDSYSLMCFSSFIISILLSLLLYHFSLSLI